MNSKIGNFDASASPVTNASAPRQKELDRIYDVFLSHRREDEALVTELYDYIEKELHFEAYVDWKDSPELDRAQVTKETADHLRRIMRHARSLIFVVGKNPGESRWTPWELGFFDGRQSAQRIRVYLPDGIELPERQEYLGLYGIRRSARPTCASSWKMPPSMWRRWTVPSRTNGSATCSAH